MTPSRVESRKQERTCSSLLFPASSPFPFCSLFFRNRCFHRQTLQAVRRWAVVAGAVNSSVASSYENRKYLRQRDSGGLTDSFRTACTPEKLDETLPSTLSSSPTVPDERRRIPFTPLQCSRMDGGRRGRDKCGSRFIMRRPWISGQWWITMRRETVVRLSIE